jgi:low affinity Fe/Cu permease
MQDSTDPVVGRLLIGTGLVLVAVGAIVIWGRALRLGSLPGDFTWSGRGWQVSLPLATCVILSVLITLVLNLLVRRR